MHRSAIGRLQRSFHLFELLLPCRNGQLQRSLSVSADTERFAHVPTVDACLGPPHGRLPIRRPANASHTSNPNRRIGPRLTRLHMAWRQRVLSFNFGPPQFGNPQRFPNPAVRAEQKHATMSLALSNQSDFPAIVHPPDATHGGRIRYSLGHELLSPGLRTRRVARPSSEQQAVEFPADIEAREHQSQRDPVSPLRQLRCFFVFQADKNSRRKLWMSCLQHRSICSRTD